MGVSDDKGNVHAAAGQAGAGQFLPKGNSAPAAGLDAAPVIQALSNHDLIEAARVELAGVADSMPNGRLPKSDERIQMLDALVNRLEQAEERDDLRNRFVDLNDVPTMGGDELESLSDRQVVFAHSRALISADRLQEHLRRRQLSPDKDASQLRVLDSRDLAEEDVAVVMSEARDQLGGVGAFRTDQDVTDSVRVRTGLDSTDPESKKEIDRIAEHWRGNFRESFDDQITNFEARAWDLSIGYAVGTSEKWEGQ